jgi:Domain of unknown function (DUF3854)
MTDALRDHFDPEHWDDLQTSGLHDEMIQAMQCYSARPHDIPRLVGWEAPQVRSGLVFPYHGIDDFVRVKCFPPYTNGTGHATKYLQRKGSGVHLYCSPMVMSILTDTTAQLTYTEGEKKAAKACQEGLLCIGLGGLWNYLENGHVIEDLDSIAHADREEFFYPDADVWPREDLRKAVYAFVRELDLRGANIRIGLLPNRPGESKLDEYLCRHTIDELHALKHIDLKHKTFKDMAKWWRGWYERRMEGSLRQDPDELEQVRRQPSFPYIEHHGRLIYLAEDRNPASKFPLKPMRVADFTARIAEDIVAEDGIRSFVVKGSTIHGSDFSLEVPGRDFMDDRTLKAVIGDAAGPRAPVYAGMHKHLGPAIQLLTPAEVRHLKRYDRTGWSDGRFLIPGREPEDTSIRLPRKLPYQIDTTADLDVGLFTLQCLLNAMTASPRPEAKLATQTTIVLTTMFQAPLAALVNWRNERYGIFIKGKSGSFKTSVSQVAMSLYGVDFMQDHLLIKLGQGATTNAAMALATHAHDLPLLIDNYKPSTGGGAKDLINLIHNILEGGEKDRLRRSADLRETKPVFCWPIFTGEDIPDHDAATAARLLIVPFAWEPGTPNGNLTAAQANACHLSAVGSAWLSWLESEEGQQAATEAVKGQESTRDSWAKTLGAVRHDMVNTMRVATNLATNQLTWQVLLKHPSIGPVLAPFREAHASGLKAIATEMASYTAEALDATRFLAALKELLASEQAALLPTRGEIPLSSERDRMVGWRDAEGPIYLLSETARKAVEQILGSRGLGDLSDTTLHTQLDGLGLLEAKGKGRLTIVKKIRGKCERVLCLKPAAIEEREDDDAQDGKNP